jgi:hypothetical protein
MKKPCLIIAVVAVHGFVLAQTNPPAPRLPTRVQSNDGAKVTARPMPNPQLTPDQIQAYAQIGVISNRIATLNARAAVIRRELQMNENQDFRAAQMRSLEKKQPSPGRVPPRPQDQAKRTELASIDRELLSLMRQDADLRKFHRLPVTPPVVRWPKDRLPTETERLQLEARSH